MPDAPVPPQPAPPKPAPPPPVPPKPAAAPPPSPSSLAHPAIGEEMDSAKWTLPPIVPVLIALAAIAIVVVIVAFANRQKPAASGEISGVQAVEMTGGQSVLVAVNLKVHNTTEHLLYIKGITAEVTLPDRSDTLKDDAASAVDFDRYYAGFPALKQDAIDPLKAERKIAADTDAAGRVIFSFPVSKAQFDARKSIAIKLDLYDQRPVVITK
jgi:hypothetical protein